MRIKLKGFESIVIERIKRARASAERTKKEANSLGHAAAGSWSVGAERNFAEGQAAINAENLAKLEKLLKAIHASLEKDATSIEPVCYIKMINNGVIDSFYLVDEPVFLKNIKMISSSSPFGQALADKKVGDKIKFQDSSIEILNVE